MDKQPKGAGLLKYGPTFPEPRVTVIKEGFSKDMPVTYGAKDMCLKLKRPKTATKKRHKWYETEAPFFDMYLQRLTQTGRQTIKNYMEFRKEVGKMVKAIPKVPVDKSKLLKQVYRKDKKKGVITDLDVKNQKIFEVNKENAAKAKLRRSLDTSLKSVESGSTAQIIRYFNKHG